MARDTICTNPRASLTADGRVASSVQSGRRRGRTRPQDATHRARDHGIGRGNLSYRLRFTPFSRANRCILHALAHQAARGTIVTARFGTAGKAGLDRVSASGRLGRVADAGHTMSMGRRGRSKQDQRQKQDCPSHNPLQSCSTAKRHTSPNPVQIANTA